MRYKIRHLHFIGVGGYGMCGLAEVMHNLGYAVSGSDAAEQPSLERLRALGATISVGHNARYVNGADCVVYSSAIGEDNPERAAASKRGVPVIPRAQMLGELLRFRPGIAVAGSHGKTTTSSMVASVLTAAGHDPLCVIGGRLSSGMHGRLGDGEFIVAEADESDASFLHLQPAVAVVTNIDDDHLQTFGGDIAVLEDAFRGFLANLPFYGAAIVCADDERALTTAKSMPSLRVITYGMNEDADVRGANARAEGMRTKFDLRLPDGGECEISLAAAGVHNVRNALAACAAGLEIGAGLNAMRKGLEEFGGVGRRLQHCGEYVCENKRALLIDDYAHHPTEINATISALRAAHPQRRMLLVFQPHRYTRTRDLLARLADAVSAADELILLDVYPAGEKPISGADSDAVAKAAKLKSVRRAAKINDARAEINKALQDGDLLVTMGAGDIGALPERLLK